MSRKKENKLLIDTGELLVFKDPHFDESSMDSFTTETIMIYAGVKKLYQAHEAYIYKDGAFYEVKSKYGHLLLLDEIAECGIKLRIDSIRFRRAIYKFTAKEDRFLFELRYGA